MNEIERNTQHRVRTLAEKLLLADVIANGLPKMGNRETIVRDALATSEIFDDVIFPEKP